MLLQSVAAAKHREAAAIQFKLPDAIKDVLNDCYLPYSKPIGVTKKYPKLYENGYFKPSIIGKESLSDLQVLSKYIKNNVKKLRFNSQWVRCEGSGKKQLQVFSAAPSFQSDYGRIKWEDKNDLKVCMYKEICECLLVEQYRALAQVSAIKSSESGQQEELHLYQVGQGSFYNPPEIMLSVLRAVKQELEGFNVKLYLHSGKGNSSNNWKSIMSKID